MIGPLLGCYKIGRAKNPAGRMSNWPIMPVELCIAAAVPTGDAVWLERYMHTAYKHCRARGEWYRLTPDDIALIFGITAANSEADLPPEIVKAHRANSPARTPRRNLRSRSITPSKCLDCANPPDHGRTRCRGCLDRIATRKRERTAMGLCQCGQRVDPGKKLCPTHLDDQARRKNTKYHARKIAGLCPMSGCPDTPAPGHAYCTRHVAMVNTAAYASRNNRGPK